MPRNLRRAGAQWRLLVHEMTPRGGSGVSYNVAHDNRFGGGDGQDSKWGKHIELPNTEFDELVVGRWLHIEQVGIGFWWLNLAGVTVYVKADRDGRPVRVHVYGPGDYDEPVPGVTYECVWSET